MSDSKFEYIDDVLLNKQKYYFFANNEKSVAHLLHPEQCWPTFRYLQKNNISVYLEEYKRIFTPYFSYIENDYFDYFVL